VRRSGCQRESEIRQPLRQSAEVVLPLRGRQMPRGLTGAVSGAGAAKSPAPSGGVVRCAGCQRESETRQPLHQSAEVVLPLRGRQMPRGLTGAVSGAGAAKSPAPSGGVVRCAGCQRESETRQPLHQSAEVVLPLRGRQMPRGLTGAVSGAGAAKSPAPSGGVVRCAGCQRKNSPPPSVRRRRCLHGLRLTITCVAIC